MLSPSPLHGLGDLEDILIRIAGICRTPRIDLRNKAVVVMCADNGVVAEGISQSGQDVTQIITENLGKGTSTVCHMAHAAGADVIPVDIGVASDIHGAALCTERLLAARTILPNSRAMVARPSRAGD